MKRLEPELEYNWGDTFVYMEPDKSGDYIRVKDTIEWIKDNLGDVAVDLFIKELDKDNTNV